MLTRYQDYAMQGGVRALTSANGARADVMRAHPGATITVFDAGTTNTVTIYRTSASGSPSAGVTAADTAAYFYFYYDAALHPTITVQISGSGFVTYTLPEIRASAATVSDINVADFGAIADGVTDATASILAALATVPATGATVVFNAGTYLVRGSGDIFTIARKGTRIRGAGVSATTITVAATGDMRLFVASAGASLLFGFSITHLSITSTDTAFTKTAVALLDTSGAEVNIQVGPVGSWHNVGKTSVGLAINGRELGKVNSRLGISADRPIVIGDNSNSFIDLDLWQFGVGEPLVLHADGHPCIEIGDCYLSNTVFDVSCNLGTDGIKFIGATNPNATTNITLRGRFEQSTSATGWAVDWQPSQSRNLLVTMFTAGFPGNGYRFRRVEYLTLHQNEFNRNAGTSLDITTCDQVDLVNNFFQSGSSFITTGLTRIQTASAYSVNPAPGAPFERWFANANVNAIARPMSFLDEYRATSSGSLAGNNSVALMVPGLASNAVRGRISLTFSGGGDGGADYVFTTTAIYKVGGSANALDIIPSANQVGFSFNSSGNITLFNDYATPINYTLSVQYFF